MPNKYNICSDIDLIEQIRLNNDSLAFSELYNRYADQLFALAYRKTNSKDAAADILQVTFIKLWKAKSNLTISHSVKAYLYTSVKNNIITHYSGKFKKLMLSLDYFTDDQLPELNTTHEAIDYNQLIKLYENSLRDLPEKCKQVFVLSRNGYTMKEIAQIQKISPKTVEVHIGKALRFLRTKLNTFF